jgi:hypothetical protein
MLRLALVGCLSICAAGSVLAGYKARPYKPVAIESYPCRLTSEGLTVAVGPLFTDALAAKVFDKKDIVTRGILPAAIIVSNNNDFPVEVNGTSIELLVNGERILPVDPDKAIRRLYGRSLQQQEVRVPSPVPLPRIAIKGEAGDAFEDLTHKHFALKTIEPKSVLAAFVYFPVHTLPDLHQALAHALIYIPQLRRAETLEEMMFFEIDLNPASRGTP